jgi:hypothetical protein
MGKKSNDPEGAREARKKTRGDWDKIISRADGRLPGGRLPGQEYNRVMSRALLKLRHSGRRAAIEWLTSCRPWLVQYAERVGIGELPSSGTILDALVRMRAEKEKQ